MLGACCSLALLIGAPKDVTFEDVHVCQWSKGLHGYRGNMGDMITLKDGSVLMSFTARDQSLAAVRSTDQGKTWSAPETLVPAVKAPAKGYLCHPGFLRCRNGDILLSYIHSLYPVEPNFASNYYRRSNDEGKTWSEPYVLTPYPGYTLVHNDRLLMLTTGRIIAMAEHKAHFPSTQDHAGYTGMSFWSDDDGYSWWPSTNRVDMQPMEVQEADAVELKDGRLMMFARTYSGHPVRAWSTDHGASWSAGEVMGELDMPYAGLPTVRRIPSTGDLLLIWIGEQSTSPDDPKASYRCALRVALSQDEGKTFTHQKNLRRDPADDFGYQCVEFVGDDLVLVGYHARDGLHVARVGVPWFYQEG